MKRLIITEEEKNRILSLYDNQLYYEDLMEQPLAQNTRQLRRDIRQDARQKIQGLNQDARDQRQSERQANQQVRQDQRQKVQDERAAQRELARTQREARRMARKEARVDSRNRKEMEQKLADFENMVRLYGNSETFKPYLQEYNTAIKELQTQLAQQPKGEVAMTGQPQAQPQAQPQYTGQPLPQVQQQHIQNPVGTVKSPKQSAQNYDAYRQYFQQGNPTKLPTPR